MTSSLIASAMLRDPLYHIECLTAPSYTKYLISSAGSFSSAAKQLRIGQPAISKTVAQLEERLGVRLLLRSTHRLTPTEAGRNFYERAKQSIEAAEEAEL